MLASGRAVTAMCHRLKKTDAGTAGTASSADRTGWTHKAILASTRVVYGAASLP